MSAGGALTAFLLYVAGVLVLAVVSNRLLRRRSFLGEYFLGSRSLGMWAFALTFAATSASGGSFTGVGPTGEGWESLAGMASLLVGLSVISGLVALAGQLSFCLAVLRTFTSGRAVSQEILAPAHEASPDTEDPDGEDVMGEGDDE